ncbi:unnamed protein product [Amaranthus hypochondriacus]
MGRFIICENDSSFNPDGSIDLTANKADGNLRGSVGRASYFKAVPLWNKGTNKTTHFTTHFSFNITQVDDPDYFGDGFAFFIAPFNESTASAPLNSTGGCLGLVGGDTKSCNVTSNYPFVAVEFDSFVNSWDYLGSDHLGINVDSVFSKAGLAVPGSLKNRTTGHATITYDPLAKNLSVFLSYDHFPGVVYNLSHNIDLISILPETVRIGFSAATGANTELHKIISWDFDSTLEDSIDIISVPARQMNRTIDPPPTTREGKSKGAVIGGLVVLISVLTSGVVAIVFFWWRRRSDQRSDDEHFEVDDRDFDQELGPKRFTYNELSRATNNFVDTGKLGEGGFGGVYRGFLTYLSKEIAVKKISSGSKQGKKEYVSEVKIISRLRHKNLVQLLGWCHEKGCLLLVYEFMPNGSLDSHLYGEDKKAVLPWNTRYKIAQGLASALLYLQQEWEQCVLHRDIKSSNVMLDINFNAKLGDFGLAKLVDHNNGSQTTVLAGTLGYLAPECVITGKSSKESDIYSFGVVALEIACGRRAIESRKEPSKVSIIDWVWNLYGESRFHEAIDERLEGEFNIQEIESLMVVGLWCCHPDHTLRPSIKQVVSVLNLDSPLPRLPLKFPMPIYSSIPMVMGSICTTSSSCGFTGSSSGTMSSSSQSMLSGSAPLLPENI